MAERRKKIVFPPERRKNASGKIICHNPTCPTPLKNPDEELYCRIHQKDMPRGEHYINYAAAIKKGT